MDATLPAVEPSGDAWVDGLPREGEVVADKYRVERLLGRGGMGAVVEARHVELGHRVAIKFLLPVAARRPEAVARFLREARAIAGMRGEHVVRVLDVGALAPAPADAAAASRPAGAPYMVMERLTGSDLSDVIEAKGALPVGLAVEYVVQACEAVAEAHGLGIVHRDLKPSNLFLHRRSDGTDVLKVLDFGIAKALSPELLGPDPAVTATGEAMGSPRYMSPELVRNAKDVDARSDVWALGVILYELVSGKPPFLADTVPATCALIVSEPARPLRDLVPDLPGDLEAVVEACLEKDVDLRMPDVATLARALRRFAATPSEARTERIDELLRRGSPDEASRLHPRSSRGTATPIASGRSGATETASAWGTKDAPPARRPMRITTVAIAALAGAVVASGVAALLPSSTAPPAAATGPETASRSGAPGPSAPEIAPAVAPAPAPSHAAPAAPSAAAPSIAAVAASHASSASPKLAPERSARAPDAPPSSPLPAATAPPTAQPTSKVSHDPLLDRK